jgi:aminoglycoside phosphotransferase (APT) family kinase protein
VWLHADLVPGNLLVDGGRLTAVLDFGCMGVGDPVADGRRHGEGDAPYDCASEHDEWANVMGRR